MLFQDYKNGSCLGGISGTPLPKNLRSYPQPTGSLTHPGFIFSTWVGAWQKLQNDLCTQQRQISLGICPVWSEILLSAWRRFKSLATKKSDQWRLIRLGRNSTSADLSLHWAHKLFCVCCALIQSCVYWQAVDEEESVVEKVTLFLDLLTAYRVSKQYYFIRASSQENLSLELCSLPFCVSLYAQSRQNLRCSLIQALNQEEPSDRKPDPWPLWMAGHAQLKFVMTECSKTQFAWRGPYNKCVSGYSLHMHKITKLLTLSPM